MSGVRFVWLEDVFQSGDLDAYIKKFEWVFVVARQEVDVAEKLEQRLGNKFERYRGSGFRIGNAHCMLYNKLYRDVKLVALHYLPSKNMFDAPKLQAEKLDKLMQEELARKVNESFADVFGFKLVKNPPPVPRPPLREVGMPPVYLEENVAIMQLGGTLSRVRCAFDNFLDEKYDMDPCKGVFALCYNQVIADSRHYVHPENIGIQRKHDGLLFVHMPKKRFLAAAYRMAEDDYWMLLPRQKRYSARISGHVSSVRAVLNKFDSEDDELAIFRLSNTQRAGGEETR